MESFMVFFAGGRGLRQGEPMSPYLFVLTMKVFSCLIGRMVRDDDFRFHWRCERKHLTHLRFADDLMIFYRVKLSTVSLIKHSLDQFQFLSGFSPNYDKSNMFPYGVEHNTKTQLLDVLGYKKGSC
jgi:hypothetical protein